MKKVILLFVLLPYLAAGQVFYNFESGLQDSWVQNAPDRWSADSSGALSGKYSLHHTFDNSEAGSDKIAVRIDNLHPDEGITTWSFVLRHGYDPSSSNNWAVYIFSDSGPSGMSPDGSINGFAVGVNLSGYDDTLRLWKVKGNFLYTVVNSGINWQTTIGTSEAVKIVIERYADGKWVLTLCRIDGDLISTGFGDDNELFESSWFGICYKYSSTRDRLLWIDDISIEGVFYEDTSPPSVTDLRITGKRSLELSVDEPPDDRFISVDNFYIDYEENKPVSVLQKNDLLFLLEFADDFINKSLNRLIIRYICDETGNVSRDTVIGFTPVWPERGDIIISEIMADPLPPVSLPGREYLEITNRTEFSFNLDKWKLIAGDQEVNFPPVISGPSDAHIVCSVQDTLLFRAFGKTIGLKQFPALTDDGKLIGLSDSSALMIHGVEYSGGWYGSDLKSNGGWSLEMIDASFPFYYEGNWSASVSGKGGTPGLVNSVSRTNRDVSFYGILNVFPDENSVITCSFPEPVGDLNAIGKGIIRRGPLITDILSSDLLLRRFRLELSAPLDHRTIYELEFPDGITDFAGNRMERSSFEFGLPEPAEAGDILFNELLFNPVPGDPDYIELYNCSEKVIDASRLHLVYVNDETSDTSLLVTLSRDRRCILPGAYYAVTTDRQKIISRYPSAVPDNLFVLSSLPSMPDDDATLILFNSELDLIDRVSYNDKMHNVLLAGLEGIALEKSGKCTSSGVASCWHSATEISGWGSPGGPNSVLVETLSHSDKFALSSTKITPDNDGYEDFLTISIAPGGYGNAVSVSVFDETGGFVRKVATNILSGAEATFIWDGTADDGSPVISGIYIILADLFDDKGKRERWKGICTVLR